MSANSSAINATETSTLTMPNNQPAPAKGNARATYVDT